MEKFWKVSFSTRRLPQIGEYESIPSISDVPPPPPRPPSPTLPTFPCIFNIWTMDPISTIHMTSNTMVYGIRVWCISGTLPHPVMKFDIMHRFQCNSVLYQTISSLQADDKKKRCMLSFPYSQDNLTRSWLTTATSRAKKAGGRPWANVKNIFCINKPLNLLCCMPFSSLLLVSRVIL